jgi:hypothetical protein
MHSVTFKYKKPRADRRHYLNQEDVLVLLGRLPGETWERLRTVHFNDRGFGARCLGYVTATKREITICALPPHVSLTRFLVEGQTCEEFGAKRGAQWPHLAVRRFMLYDVVLHEIGHLQLINERTKSDRLRFAREKLAERFADKWRRRLWASYFDHPDPIHNSPFR